MARWYTPQQALDTFFKADDGTYLISKSSLLAMCRNGDIPTTKLGMKRRVFLSEETCIALGKDVLR